MISMPESALYITFFPSLSAEPIPLPTPRTVPGAVFVCANSLVVSDKVVGTCCIAHYYAILSLYDDGTPGAKTRYNLRVVETLVSARVLARHLGVVLKPIERPPLREVLGRWLGYTEAKDQPSDLDTETLRDGLQRVLPEVEKLRPARSDGQLGVTMEEMIEWSGLEESVFREVYLSWVDGACPPRPHHVRVGC